MLEPLADDPVRRPVHRSVHRSGAPPARTRRRGAGYAAGTLAVPLFHLRHLVAAGVPLAEALVDVAALEPRGARRALWRDAATRVAAGASLSRALADFPADIDPTALALVRAGEAGGRLPALLAELEAHLRWRHELGARLRTVTLYPLFATLVLLAVTAFLIGHVVPALARFLEGGGTALAWHGTLLLALGRFVADRALPLALLVAVPLAAFALAPRLGARAHRVHDALVLRAGGVGRLVAALATARWARTTALLYGSGIALDEALAIAEGTLGNRALADELAGARAALLGGCGLGAALGACPSVPRTLARLVAAGESAGALGDALEQGAVQLRSSSDHAIARLEALIGPALLCATGTLLLWIVVSVLSPLYTGAALAGSS